jgi:hypothetical protein
VRNIRRVYEQKERRTVHLWKYRRVKSKSEESYNDWKMAH